MIVIVIVNTALLHRVACRVRPRPYECYVHLIITTIISGSNISSRSSSIISIVTVIIMNDNNRVACRLRPRP